MIVNVLRPCVAQRQQSFDGPAYTLTVTSGRSQCGIYES